MTVSYTPIGTIHSPHREPEGTPIQPPGAEDVQGVVVLDPDYADGLRDLDGFSHIILLYHCHRSGTPSLTVEPFLDQEERGVFATRAPSRPNAIGLSVVTLERIEGNRLFVTGIDILDGTPLLDIKPYVPVFDAKESVVCGWLDERADNLDHVDDDGRFADDRSEESDGGDPPSG